MNPEAAPESAPPPKVKETVGCLPFVIGGASFIPLFGVLFGIIAIIWGIVRHVRSLVIVGSAGICFSIILYGSLFYFGFVHRGGTFDKLRGQLAVSMLDSTVREIEYYKIQHGHYPTSLDEIVAKDKQSMPVAIDPTAAFRSGEKGGLFYYELNAAGTHYFLRSVGPDGIPFTPDDILPSIPESERKRIGLLLTREEANQLPDPTPASVTPRAGQESRPR